MTDAHTDGLSQEQAKLILEVWKKTIDVQQHFNDLELRIRNFAVTVLVAVLSGAGLAMREHFALKVFGAAIPLSAWLVGAGLIGWLAFYFMDRWWYHRFLVGSVKNGIVLERRLEGLIGEAKLTVTIGEESPFDLFGWRVHSNAKMDLFYLTIGAMLLLIALGMFISQPA